jgi:2-(1,2-epoxy-1,2-dihydrophenyl)acetyl-CoA isomerase
MLTNRVLSSAEAVQWGILNQAVAADDLDDVVAKLAATIASGPTLSFGKVKALLNQSFDNGLETQMELESRAISDASRTLDGQEGMNAFVEKRKPTFTGK